MKKAIEIIDSVAEKSESVILFHSASGKDSIALLDLLYPRFKRVVCVFMYMVKDLRHINRYIAYAQKKYATVEFMQIPHYDLFNYIKLRYMGISQDEKIKQYSLYELTEKVRAITEIEWACFGFKQADGLNRRLMLRTYPQEAINEKTKKFYPLSSYKNEDVLKYIEENKLIRPELFGKYRSNGAAVNDINYLLYLRENYPDDLRKTINTFPMCERLLFEHDYKKQHEYEISTV